MEKLLKSCKPNKMEKGALAKWIYEHQADIVEYYIKKGFVKESQPVVNMLYSKMKSEKFPKAMRLVIKKGKKDPESEIFLEPGFAVVINGFIEYINRQEDKDNYVELCEEYYEIVDKLLGKRAKKIAKKSGIDKDVVMDLLVIAPSTKYLRSEKSVGFASQKMLRKLYYITKEKSKEDIGISSTKNIKRFFANVFKEDLLDLIAINILLEKKEFIKGYNDKQLAMWNLMTEFALNLLENQKKKHIGELLKFYGKPRMNDERHKNDSARRIVLATLPEEDYPNINKVINKLNAGTVKYL